MNGVDLRTYSNEWYQPGSKLKILGWYFVSRLFINTSIPIPYAVKARLLRMFGAKIGKNIVVKQNVSIKYPWFLTIGDNAWIGEHVWIDNLSDVVIGKNCCLSQGSMLLTGNHDYTKTSFDLMTKPIILHDGAWVGAKAVVCPGVTMHSHALLSVNSVATKNLDDFGVYQGNPAIFIKKRVIS